MTAQIKQRNWVYTSSRIAALFFLIQLVGDYKENYHCMYLYNSVLDMLKHKFTHYTNTKLRTVIKCVHKMGVLLSLLIQLLLLCSVLLLNLVLFVNKNVQPYSAISNAGELVGGSRDCLPFHLSHFASARKLVYRHNLSIENFVPSLISKFAVCFMNCSIHYESTSPGGTDIIRWSPGPRNLLWAMYFTTRTLRRIHKLNLTRGRTGCVKCVIGMGVV